MLGFELMTSRTWVSSVTQGSHPWDIITFFSYGFNRDSARMLKCTRIRKIYRIYIVILKLVNLFWKLIVSLQVVAKSNQIILILVHL